MINLFIAVFIAFYAFMAGMMAEYTHTRMTKLGLDGDIITTCILASVLWPIAIWKVTR